MESWDGAATYESYMGRWSRPLAARFVEWLDPPPRQRWLDVGCGTGILSAAVLAAADPVSVVGVDPSDAFVRHAAGSVTDPRASFRVGTAQDLPVEAGSADVAAGGLVLNFVPDPQAALASMRAAVAAGGLVAAYVWDYADGMQMLRQLFDAAAEIDPDGAAEHDEGRRFPLARRDALRSAFADAGLTDVVVDELVVPTVFTDFDDYWQPFLAGSYPAPAYVCSLDESSRTRLRDVLRERLPVAADGSVPLTARAWVASGRSGQVPVS